MSDEKFSSVLVQKLWKFMVKLQKAAQNLNFKNIKYYLKILDVYISSDSESIYKISEIWSSRIKSNSTIEIL